MRWFIVLLLLANVVLFFWVQQQSRPTPGSTPLPPPDIGQLHLASEAKEDQSSGIDATPQPHAMPETPYALVQPESSEAAVEPPRTNGASESTDMPESVGLAAQQASTLRAVANAAPVEAEQAAVAREGADETSKAVAQHALDDALQTAVQVPEDLADSEADVSVQEVEPPVVEEPQTVCSQVGPLIVNDADQLIKGLPSSISLLSDVIKEHGQVVGYYVLIPAPPSRPEAIRTMQKLEDAGIKDTWLFRTGDLRNSISLGMFSREPGAKRRAKSVAEKGFTTEVQERTWMRERRWLLLKSTDGSDLRSSLTLPDGVEIEQRACP